MSPQECWLIIDQNRPPEKVGTMRKDTFDRLKGMLHDDG